MTKKGSRDYKGWSSTEHTEPEPGTIEADRNAVSESMWRIRELQGLKRPERSESE